MKKMSLFSLILFVSCHAGKFKWKAVEVKQEPQNFDEQRQEFIDRFNNASQEEKILMVKRGIFTNPETNLLYPWVSAVSTEDHQKIWNELKDVPIFYEK